MSSNFSFGKINGSALAEWTREYQENQNKFKEEIKVEYKWKYHEYAAFFHLVLSLIGNLHFLHVIIIIMHVQYTRTAYLEKMHFQFFFIGKIGYPDRGR